ncbi:MAG TPA: PEGA domain-containing protein [Polyangiaceae bacterium]
MPPLPERRASPSFARAQEVLSLALMLLLFSHTAQADKPKTPAKKPAAESAAPVGPKPLSETLTGDAKQSYDAARLLYADGDYAGALIKFQGAFEVSKDSRLLWNMAACEKNLRHYAKVLSLVQRYLKEGGALLSDQDRNEAKDLTSAIESFTAALIIKVNQSGAEVFVDDEPVGTSPLPEPITVDIGMRHIRVKKEGFRELSLSVPIGGSKEVTQDLKLEREVHQGKLTVHAAKGAAITLDGKAVGTGKFSGTVPSGGHTLRVSKAGMRPYQSEVVVQDNETRTVDVALEVIPTQGAAAEEPTGVLHGFELGLRTGIGSGKRQSGETISYIPIWLDIGYRLGRPTLLGIYAQYGAYNRGTTCAAPRHGPLPESSGDLATRYSYDRCFFLKAGVELLFHLLPRTIVDPWFGFDVAFQHSEYQWKAYDPLTGQTPSDNDEGNSFQPGLQLGVSAHPWPWMGAGVFYQFALLIGEDVKVRDEGGQVPVSITSISGTGSNGCNPCGSTNEEHNGPKPSQLFGLRAFYTFQ